MNNSNAKKRNLFILRVLALLFVVTLTIFIFVNRNKIEEFKAYGYPGVFLIALLANSTVFIPAPGIAIVFAMGSVLNPLGVALAASAGGTLGEISGYLAGFSSQAIIEQIDIYKKVEPFVRRYGAFAVLIFAAIPNPFFDLAGIAAGALKMRFFRFIIFCWAGQFIKMTGFSLAGYYSINWMIG
jgi:membrane protein DedA with SNARE-associated domain